MADFEDDEAGEFEDAVGYHSDVPEEEETPIIPPSPQRELRASATDDVLGELGELALDSPTPSASPPPAEVPTRESEPPSEAVDEPQPKQRKLYVLSDAGKPIWTSTDEPEEVVAPLMGLITAVVGFAQMRKDTLKCVRAGRTKIVFLIRGALVLLAVSPFDETEAYLALILETIYQQILFTLTSLVQRKLQQSSSYDLRNLLEGTENILNGISERARNGPGLLTGGVRALFLPRVVREEASRVLQTAQTQSPDILYAILLSGDRLVTVVQPRLKERQLHVTDLRLIINFVNSQPALKGTESWTPLCLPRFNANGYLYSYIGFLDEESTLGLLLISNQQKPETFHLFQQWKQAVTQALLREGTMRSIIDNARRYALTSYEDRHCTRRHQILHFVFLHYASRDGVQLPQYVSPPLTRFPFVTEEQQMEVWTGYQKVSLRLRYASAQPEEVMPDQEGSGEKVVDAMNRVWEAPPLNNVIHQSHGTYLFVGYAGPTFELMATFPSTMRASDTHAICQKLARDITHDIDDVFCTKPVIY